MRTADALGTGTGRKTGDQGKLARWTGLEPATPGVTGRYSNQLSYHRALWGQIRGCPGGVKRETKVPGSSPAGPGQTQARSASLPPQWGRDGVGGLRRPCGVARRSYLTLREHPRPTRWNHCPAKGCPAWTPCGRRERERKLARWTGLEPATPGVTGRYSNQLSYHRALGAD